MSSKQELEDTLGQVCHLAFQIIGRTLAYEIYIQSLVDTLVNQFPELREPLKEKFTDVSDLQRRMIESKVAADSYDETVKILMGHFKLMKGGGFFEEK